MSVALVGMICAMSMMPGTSTTVILDTTWTFGRRLGFLTAVGGSIGVAVYTIMSVFAGTYLRDYGLWINLLEGAGALYLAVLGLTGVVEAFTLSVSEDQALTSPRGIRALFSGLVSTCASPKIAIFYLIILARWDFGSLPAVYGVLLAGSIHILTRLIWYGTWIHIIHPIRQTFKTVWVQRSMKLATAMMMLALSLHVLL